MMMWGQGEDKTKGKVDLQSTVGFVGVITPTYFMQLHVYLYLSYPSLKLT